ncbi:MAG: prephenate dehydratase domain-containing protein [Pyrinomonadaceae bacterium]
MAIQGIAGSYSDDAANILVPSSEIVECRSFNDTFEAVTAGVAECAVVPLRNKIVGEIVPATNALARSGLRPFESIELTVKHVLTAVGGATLETIKKIISHPEAIKQCRNFFESHPEIEAISDHDTASSVRKVAESNDVSLGAIASERASVLFGTQVIARDIADDIDNYTTFYLVKR